MFMAPIEPTPPRHSHRIVRLMRRWAAEGRLGDRRLAGFVAFAGTIGVQPVPAVAIASLFQLTEACLGRPLVAECCCSRNLSRDERAILLMLGSALPAHPHRSGPQIPHGLPGALLWAIESVRTLFGADDQPTPGSLSHCPFRVER